MLALGKKTPSSFCARNHSKTALVNMVYNYNVGLRLNRNERSNYIWEINPSGEHKSAKSLFGKHIFYLFFIWQIHILPNAALQEALSRSERVDGSVLLGGVLSLSVLASSLGSIYEARLQQTNQAYFWARGHFQEESMYGYTVCRHLRL